MDLFQPMMVAALIVSGMGVALLGSVKVPLAGRLRIDEARVGGLVSLFGFVMIPVILTAGFLTDLAGRRPVLVAGSVLLAVSLALLARARAYPGALLAVLLLGGSWSLLVNVGNVLVPAAFPGSTAFATNLANVFFGLGAFLTPLVVALWLRRASLPAALAALGVLALVPALLALAATFPAAPAPSAASAGEELAELLANPVLWLCGLALFFYGPLEASMAAWATTYLGEQGVGPARAAGLLAGFWLAFMASRLATALLLPEGREAVFVLVLALACVAVLAGVVLGRGPRLAEGLVLASGLVFGPVFPTLVAVLLDHVEPRLHGRAVGLFFAVGGLGWTAIPLLIGAYARRAGVRRGFAVAVGAAAGLSAVALLLALR